MGDDRNEGAVVSPEPDGGPARVPLTGAQRPFWLAQRLDPDAALTVALYVDISAPVGSGVDLARLERAMYAAGTESGLRQTRLAQGEDDEPCLIHVEDAVMNLDVLDLRGDADPEASAHAWMRAEFREPVDLHGTVLVRCVFLRLDDHRTFLYLRAHHVVLDGQGAFTLLGRIAGHYSGTSAPGPAPTPDTAARIHDAEVAYAASRRHDADLAHWREHLAGVGGPTALSAAPPSAPRQPVATRLPWTQPRGTAADPLAVVAALAVHQSRVLDTDDVVLGFPVTGRTTAALRATAGMMANLVPLRLTVDSTTAVRELLVQVRREITGALRHQRFRDWDQLLPPEVRPFGVSFGPVVNIMPFVAPLQFDDISAPVGILSSGPVHDTAINIYTGDTLTLDIQWNPERYDASDIDRHGVRLTRLLGGIVAADDHTTVGDLAFLDDGEAADLLDRSGGPAPTATTLGDLMAAVARSDPAAPAVRGGTATLTYGELDDASGRLARTLRDAGATPGTVVALALPRSVDQVIALWAVVRTGAAFLPVDPADPAERLTAVLAESGVTLVVTTDRHPVDLPSGTTRVDVTDVAPEPLTREHPAITELAYVMYTSGSTGRPKGVAITHAGLHGVVAGHRARGAETRVPEMGGSRVLAVAAPTFDASISEHLLALALSGCLVVAGSDAYSGAPLQDLLRRESITHAILTPRVLETLSPTGAPSLRQVLSVGDVCSPALASRWSTSPGLLLHNDYGPTETTVWATGTAPLAESGTVTIGRPLPGVRAVVLDSRLRPVPVGVPGELHLAGAGLARGYVGRSAETAARFVAGVDGTRLYRTGDRARWTSSGDLEYLGRTDSQVKVRGRRVEPGEIDTALVAVPGVTQAVTVVRRDGDSEQLVSYVTGDADPADVLAAVVRTLPSHLVPVHVVPLDALPLTASGKVDVRALPEPERRTTTRREPASDVERRLLDAVSHVLSRNDVGVDDDFFALGGDSILSIRLVTVAAASGVRISARDVVEQRSAAGLARVADTVGTVDEPPGSGIGRVDPTPIVRHLLERGGTPHQFAQTLTLSLPVGIDRASLVSTIEAVVAHHDMLRSVLVRDADGVHLEVRPRDAVRVDGLLRRGADLAVEDIVATLDPENGVMLGLGWNDLGEHTAGRLVIAAHHLVVDVVSWGVLVADLVAAWAAVRDGVAPTLAPVRTSMRRWSSGLAAHDASARLPYWTGVLDGPDPVLGQRLLDPVVDRVRDTTVRDVAFPAEIADALLVRAPTLFHAGPTDALLAALALALATWRQDDAPTRLVQLEGHGREDDLVPGADTGRTVGWFTTVFPVRLDLTGLDIAAALRGGPAAGEAILRVKEHLARVPDHGASYGLLRHGADDDARHALRWTPQISFAHLGRMTTTDTGDWLPVPGISPLSGPRPEDLGAAAVLEIDTVVLGDTLIARLSTLDAVLADADVEAFVSLWVEAATAVARHVDTPGAGGRSPSDFPLVDATPSDVDGWTGRHPTLIDVLPTAPLQAGLLMHARLAAGSVDPYVVQTIVHLGGALDADRLQRAAHSLVDRHGALRVAFDTTADGTDVQVIAASVTVPWTEVDVRADPDPAAVLDAFLAHDRGVAVDVAAAPLLRVALLHTGDERHTLVLTHHHLLLDGWSLPIVLADLLADYAGEDPRPAPPPLRGFLQWVSERDTTASLAAWSEALAGSTEATLLAPAHGSGTDEAPGQRIATLSTERTAELVARAGAAGVTVNTLVQLAWALVLGSAVGRTDVVFGATVSGRPAELDGSASMVGLLISTVPVRVRLDRTATVRESAQRLQREQAALLDHHHLAPSAIEAEVGPGAGFDTSLAFESYPLDRTALTAAAGDLSVLGVEARDATHYPLSLAVEPGESLVVRATHRRDVLDTDAVDRLLDRLLRVLEALDPSRVLAEIDLLGVTERTLVTETWNSTRHPLVPTTLLDAVPALDPSRVAFTHGDRHVTRAEFSARVHRLARYLISRGAGPETAVAVALERSIDLLVAVHAVVATGAHYVPLDPGHPAERLRHTVTMSGARLGIGSAATLPEAVEWITISDAPLGSFSDTPLTDDDRLAPLRPDHLAYVLFTSGSTGQPKGVGVSHAAIVNQLRWRAEFVGVTADDIVLHKTPATFDVSVWELFLPWQIGARVVVADPDDHRDADLLVELIARHRVSVVHAVPSMLALMADAPGLAACTSLRTILSSGEALPAGVAAAVRAVLPVRVVNLYGPTEAAVDVTAHVMTDADTTDVPLGRPVWNTTTLVLDDALRPVPVDVPGELYLGGAQLARGYAHRTALTAERFVAGPDGSRLYRTGDRVRWSAAGDLHFLGRSDDQLSVRGVRVEPAEIEAVLTRSGLIDRAVAAVVEDRLVAYVVPTRGRSAVPEALLQSLRSSLPRHLVPDDIVEIETIPLTASGKVDKRALPAPARRGRVHRTPFTPTQRVVADIVEAVLQTSAPVGADDDVFALGATSLSAARVVARIRSATGRDLTLRTLFDVPTIAGLAAAVDAGDAYTDHGFHAARPDRIPLTHAQHRMWFLDRYEPGSYVMPLALRVRGDLDLGALSSAIGHVMTRHEILRTVYADADGVVHQVVLPPPAPTTLTVTAVTPDALVERLSDARTTRFDLATEPPLRAEVLRLADDEHVLLLTVHHIAADGLSLAPLTRDLLSAYQSHRSGRVPAQSPLSVQYADVAVRQTELGVDSDAAAWWKCRLSGLPDVLDMPLDRPRPERRGRASDAVRLDLDDATVAALSELAVAHRATVFMVVHTALAVALARWTGSTDIAVGSPISGRPDPALDDLVGLFVDTVVLRTRVDPSESFAELLSRTRDETVDAFAHAHVPFDHVVDTLGAARTSAHHPVFQVVLAFQDVDPLPGSPDIEVLDVGPAPATFDLTVDVRPAGAGLAVVLTYACDLFDHTTAECLSSVLEHVLRAAARGSEIVVGDIAIRGADEPDTWTHPDAHTTPTTLPALLDAHADGSAVAVIEGDTVLTRDEWARASNRWARRLIALGAGPETVVAVAVARSARYLVLVAAISRAGAAFVPLDPEQPRARLADILTEAAPTLVLADTAAPFPTDVVRITVDDPATLAAVAALSDAPITDRDRRSALRPDHLAYVLYTSGSTGRPKGVAVTHRGLHNAVQDQRARHAPASDARVLAVSSTTFDASVGELVIALALDAALVVAPPEVYAGVELRDLMRRHRVTHTLMTPRALDATPDPGGDLRVVMSAGEACPPSLVDTWAPGRTMTNVYGPTEATIWSTTALLAAGHPVTVGSPTLGVEVSLRDVRLHAVPDGVVGELYVAGDHLARGYLGRPGLTASRFVAAPDGQRTYRTGDLMRRNAVGDLLYLGRSDHQITVRGLRIELGDVETALVGAAGVGAAAAGVIDERLVGYVVAADGHSIDAAEVSAAAAAALPRYLVPAAVVVMDALPMTTSGKLDRARLPRPPLDTAEFRAPSTAGQVAVAAVFATVLELADPVGLDDDFFALGGHSLSATRVAARLQVPVRSVFEAPTVHALAAQIDAVPRSALAPRRTRPRPDMVPLSFAQQRMWFLNTVSSDSGYVIPLALGLRGVLDHGALQGALADVVDRHEILRTVYPAVNGVPQQHVLDHARIAIDRESETPEAVLDRMASAPFDLAADLPLRASVVAVTEKHHVLLLVLHHIAADGWSLAPLTRDLTASYAARRSGREWTVDPLPMQYADHAVWQQDHADDIRGRVAFWTDRLAGLPDVLPLPTDRPRPPVASHRGARVRVTVPDATTAALRALATAHHATLVMVLQAAWAVTLARVTGSEDIAVGTPVAGRGHEDLDELVGMFVDTVVHRAFVTGTDTVAALVDQVREDTVAALDYADVPFELIVDALDPVRSTAHHPVVQVMFAFQNQTPPTLVAAGLEIDVLDSVPVAAPVDLTLDLTETGDGLSGALTYAVDLFDRRTAAGIVDVLLRVLDAVARRPFDRIGALEILHPSERALLLSQHGSAGLPPRVLPRLLADAVAGNPDGPALIGERTLTYTELDRRSNRWARALIALGAAPDTVVAVALPRSVDQITAVWAVAKTGAAFLPIDPDGPPDRLRHMLTETGANVAVTAVTVPAALVRLATVSPTVLDTGAESEADVTPADRLGAIRPDTLAYVIHTSGSTGTPKGVGVTHRGLVDALWDQRLRGAARPDQRLREAAEARVLAVASPTFDASIAELLIAVALSAPLVVAPPDVFGGPALGRLVAESAVTHALLTPRVLDSLIPEDVPSLHVLVTAGEACPPALAARWAPGRRLFNDYGPTETTVWATSSGPLRADDAVTIGRPVRGVGARVLDTFLRPVPIGVVGELYLDGTHLARGYVGRPTATAERFVAAAQGARLYRTGDRVRWTSGGDLEYLGRTDVQVKLRGLRIEPGEIEAALASHPAIDRAVVLVQDDHLVAYVVPSGTSAIDPADLRHDAARRLPRYMVPAHIVTVDAIPLTASGKLDRRALLSSPRRPASGLPGTVPTVPRREAVGPAERAVAEAFATVLELPELPGLDDDFFALGGHSLSATRVAARVSAATEREVSVRAVFDHPTVGALAAVLVAAPTAARTPLTAAPRPDRVPLSFAQHRMWFLGRVDADRGGQLIPLALRLTGPLDVDALRSALDDVTLRHEILRTVHPALDGVPHQVVSPTVDVPVEIVRTSAADVPAAVSTAAAARIDVTTETPLRATLLVVSPTDHVLVILVHHIAADGWSMAPLTRDVVTAYAARAEGRPLDLPPLPVQYADHALAQRAALGSLDDPGSALSRHLAHWRERLAGVPLDLALPTDRPRPRTPSQQGDRVRTVLDADALGALRSVAQAHDVTLFMVAHTALSIVLAQWAGTRDLLVGTAVAGRTDPALDDVVGMFVDTVVLRSTIDEDGTVADHLAAARETTLDAFAHAALPFETLVTALDPVRSTASHPVVQVMLTLQNTAPPRFPDTTPAVEVLDLGGAPVQFDLAVTLREDQGRLLIELSYATDLFDRSTIERVSRRLAWTLRSMTRDTSVRIGDLETVEPAERAAMRPRSGAPALAARTLDHLVADAVAARPGAIALRANGIDLSYADLSARANRLARELIACGAGPDVVVALAMPRSIDHVLSVWAVAAAGAAFLSVDPAQPAERIAHILQDSGAVVVITESRSEQTTSTAAPWIPRIVLDDPDVVSALDRHPAHTVLASERRPGLHPSSIAYVIYTSGSTGRPKGVAVTHAGLADALADQRSRRGDVPDVRVLAVASPTFDASIAELLMALAHCGTLVLAPAHVHSGDEVGALIRHERVTHTIITPRVLDSLDPAGLDCVRVLVVGGEALPDHLAATWSAGREMYDDYGPTETTVWATAHGPITPDRPVGIGTPVRGVDAVVLDGRLRPVPLGAVGELYLSGPHLARGYVEQTGLTASRFVAAPYGPPGARLYRTGDLVRWNSAGELAYLGRSDFQIKLRGLRIEPGEIENAALAHPAVTQAVVLLNRDAGTGSDHLVAYVAGDGIDVASVREAVAERVPQYMVPSRVIALDAVPRTIAGKVDRAALPAPTFAPTVYRAPTTSTEHMVADAFALVLGVGDIGLDDDFFALGGTSLTATRVAAHLGRAAGVDRVLRLLFSHGTVGAVAEHLDREDDDESIASSDAVGPVLRLGGGVELAPVFCIHPMMGLAWPYFELGRHLETGRPLYGVQTPAVADPDFAPRSMDDVVERYVEEIRHVDPVGPYHLVGWSVGGVLAHAVAARMQSQGHTVASLSLLDPVHSIVPGSAVKKAQADAMFGAYQHLTDDLADMTPDALWSVWSAMGGDQLPVSDIQARLITKAMLTLFALVDEHVPPTYSGAVLMIDSDVTAVELGRMSDFWSQYCTGPADVESVPWRHGELLSSDAVADIGPLVGRWLGRVETASLLSTGE
ncbi:non-ribosomal peptide synthetase [Rhodococcus sp. NBC_00297]|uniref:non-ribosomal peptide synthetase n=1 Tax=Rhodococcus sp. NBC_00297 TaxID=2976005 RepID=UPI002E27DF9B|nr:non-ribosomal peptide synthetase [Rhodococcus sp. NBC_00297]